MRTLSFPFVTHVFKKYKEINSVKIMNEIYLHHTSKLIPIYCTSALVQ
jgi:hypothetical protein